MLRLLLLLLLLLGRGAGDGGRGVPPPLLPPTAWRPPRSSCMPPPSPSPSSSSSSSPPPRRVAPRGAAQWPARRPLRGSSGNDGPEEAARRGRRERDLRLGRHEVQRHAHVHGRVHQPRSGDPRPVLRGVQGHAHVHGRVHQPRSGDPRRPGAIGGLVQGRLEQQQHDGRGLWRGQGLEEAQGQGGHGCVAGGGVCGSGLRRGEGGGGRGAGDPRQARVRAHLRTGLARPLRAPAAHTPCPGAPPSLSQQQGRGGGERGGPGAALPLRGRGSSSRGGGGGCQSVRRPLARQGGRAGGGGGRGLRLRRAPAHQPHPLLLLLPAGGRARVRGCCGRCGSPIPGAAAAAAAAAAALF